MEYREALLKEIHEVALLHNQLTYAIQRETKDIYWDFKTLSVEDTYQYLLNFKNHEQCKIYVAYDGQTIVGFIMGEIVQCHLPVSGTKYVGYISGAYVVNEYRRQGIMRQLENCVISFFKEKGLNYCELNFLTRNEVAKETWEAMGYQTFRQQARKSIY